MNRTPPDGANCVSDAECHVLVIIVNYRTPELTTRALKSLVDERSDFSRFDVTVVDGGSGDDSAEALRIELSGPTFEGWTNLLALEVNGGFGWANNHAILNALCSDTPPKYIYLLNPDATVLRGAIKRLARVLDSDPRTAAVGSQLIDEGGAPVPSAFRFPSLIGEFLRGARTGFIERILSWKPLFVDSAASLLEVDWVTGASMMLRSDALRDAGLFDDGFFLYFEELELMWRFQQAGWVVKHEPLSKVSHIGGASTGVDRHISGERPAAEPRKPSYWYESRRRYFALTSGYFGPILATVFWISGHLLWRARRVVGLTRETTLVDSELSDHVRFAIPSYRSLRRAKTKIDCERRSMTYPDWMRADEG